jgi:hypothetical protein
MQRFPLSKRSAAMTTPSRSNLLPGLFVSFTVLAPVAAQALISPAINRTREGNGWAHFPFFGSAVPERYLQLHCDLPGARTISALVLRPDGFSSDAVAFGGTLRLSNAPAGVDCAAPAPTFAGNHGSNQVTMNVPRLDFPAQTFSAGDPFPRPFAFAIPLPTPFASNGMSALVWDVEVTTRFQMGSGNCDAVQGLAGAWNVADRFGQGCRRSSTGFPALHDAQMAPQWGAGPMTVTLVAANMDPRQDPPRPVVFAIGLSSTSWQGLSLPFELPGTRTAPSGPCWINSSWEILLAGAVGNSNGFATMTFAAPEPRTGINLYTQAIGWAPNANPGNLITSNSVHTYLAPPITSLPPVAFLHSVSTQLPTQTPHAGYVVEFR